MVGFKSVLSVSLLCLTYLISPIVGIPSLHTVNDFTLSGDVCPLQSLFNQECGFLCVKDVKDCPGSTKLECEKGTELCIDGTCQSDCSQAINICACGLESFDYFPCGGIARSNVANLIPENRTSMIADACSANLKLSESDYELWSENPIKPYVWLSCPLPPVPTFTLTEPMFIGFYAVVGFEFLLFLLWHFYKIKAESSIERPPPPTTRTKTSNEQYRFEGYKNNIFGTLMHINTHTISVVWLILLAFIVSDNYGVINNTFYYVFLSSDLVSKTFVTMWVFTGVWLAVLNFSKDRSRNYFRIRSQLSESNVVQIEKYPDQMVVMSDGNKYVAKFKAFEQKVKEFLLLHLIVTTVPILTSSSGRKYFQFQCMRFVLDTETSKFNPSVISLPLQHHELHKLSHGLTTEEVNLRTELFGPNLIEVPIPSFFKALFQELASFFYLYQMMCLWIWYFFTYYQMGLVQTFVIIVSALIRVVIRIKSEKQIKGLAEFLDECQVLRNGEWSTITSDHLVPGDIFRVLDNRPIPCDAVLLSGEVIVDESMLTGEAMPIRKVAIKDDANSYDTATGAASTLISGTNALQVTPSPGSEDVIALVSATAINTDKGSLIQRILFPSSISFVFQDHLKLVVIVLLGWGIVCFCLSLYFMGRGDINSFFYGMFVISQIMSPLLPSALVAGQSVAASRLKKLHDIFCVDLPRIMVAGKVKVFCFDKTGTLTKEGLNFHGVKVLLPPAEGQNQRPMFDQLTRTESEVVQLSRVLQMGLATCHDVTELKGKLIGNPVDVELFKASSWHFDQDYNRDSYVNAFQPKQDNPISSASVHVVKTFEFVHSRASMAVIVEDKETQKWHIYIKGSYERCKLISNPESIPNNFDSTTVQMAKEGCYVLGIAHRDLGILNEAQQTEVRGWSRDQVESEATLLGLILFRNQLKEDTVEAIHQLQQGDTRCLMITGDNAFTGTFVARSCGMIPPGAQVLLGALTAEVEKSKVIQWTDIDTDQVYPDESLTDLLYNSTHPVELAVTGKAFDFLVANNRMRELLPYTRVYARMTPEGKVECVELQMEKAITGMCGDGGNDCGALRAAHVGIALSEAEASIVSPFSAKDRSVMSCVTLLRYGRAALASSFSCYKFLILYGEIMAWLELTQFYFSVVVSQPIWITIDGFVVVLMLITLALAKPADTLAPTRPTAKLLGPQTLVSAISQSVVNLIFLASAITMLFHQSFFKCNEFNGMSIDSAKWWLLGDNYEAEIIGLVCLFQFINAAGVFNFGHKYRASWYKNYPLALIYLGMLAFCGFLVLAGPNWLSCTFRINCGTELALTDILNLPAPNFVIQEYNNPIGHNVMPMEFRIKLAMLILGNCLTNLFVEYFFILNGPFNRIWKKLKGDKIQRDNASTTSNNTVIVTEKCLSD